MRIILAVCSIDDIFKLHPFAAFSIHEARPPLGLGSLAASLAAAGHEVKVLDQAIAPTSAAEFARQIYALSPAVVGFSCTSLNVSTTRACITEVKQRMNAIWTVVGGIHASLCPEDCLRETGANAVIAGEAEDVLCSVVDEIGHQGRLSSAFPGVWLSGQRPLEPEVVLTHLTQPYPARDALQISRYSNHGSLVAGTPCLALFQSRGCPYLCAFCSKPGYHKTYRTRPIDKTMAEIEHLVVTHGAASLCFREDNLTANREHLLLLCEAIRTRYGDDLAWECESRADLPERFLEKMRAAGCRGVWCGVETVVPRWQAWLNKLVNTKAIRRFYHACHALGIRTGALFLFGFPDQTEDERSVDVDFAMALPVVWRYFQCLAIFPGSRLTQHYLKNRRRLLPLTTHVAIALTAGHGESDMLGLERSLNERIRVIEPAT